MSERRSAFIMVARPTENRFTLFLADAPGGVRGAAWLAPR